MRAQTLHHPGVDPQVASVSGGWDTPERLKQPVVIVVVLKAETVSRDGDGRQKTTKREPL